MLKYLVLGTAKCGTTTFAGAASAAGLKVFKSKETFLPLLKLGIGKHERYGLVEQRSEDKIKKELKTCDVVVGTYYILDARTYEFFREYCDQNTKVLLFIRDPLQRIKSSYLHLLRVKRISVNLDEFVEQENSYINDSYDPMFYSTSLSNYSVLIDEYVQKTGLDIRVIDSSNINNFIKDEFQILQVSDLNRSDYNWQRHFKIKTIIKPFLTLIKLMLGSNYGKYKANYLQLISEKQIEYNDDSLKSCSVDMLKASYLELRAKIRE